MNLKEVGTREVITAFRDESLIAAAKKMRDAHVGDVVVVKRRGTRLVPVGILTDRDIVVATVALKVPVDVLSVGDVMTYSLISARETDGISKALELMRDHGVRRIPIVGKAGDVKGIVAIEDIIGFMTEQLSTISEIFSRERKLETRRRLKIA